MHRPIWPRVFRAEVLDRRPTIVPGKVAVLQVAEMPRLHLQRP